MSKKTDDPLVAVNFKLPRSVLTRIDRAAAAWNLSRTAVLRRAIEDGLMAWGKGEMQEDEALTLLRFVCERTLTVQAMMNILNAGAIDDAFLDELASVKAEITKAAHAGR